MTKKSKLINTLAIGSILAGSSLMFKGYADTIKYEDSLISQGKEYLVNETKPFYDKKSLVNYISGLSFLVLGISGLGYKKKQ